MTLATNIAYEACRVILFSSNRELRTMFDRKDARIFHKAAKRIEKAYRKPKTTPYLKDLP